MGSYDGAEICELVGLFILNNLGKSFGKENIGLYRDNGWQSLKKQVSTFGRQNKKRTSQSFQTIWLENYSGVKFTRDKTF